MKYYPYDAITFKDVNQFSFGTYLAISVNMLKYNHDSSATFRLISSVTESMEPLVNDVNFGLNFGMQKLSFIAIDRLNGFSSEVDDIRSYVEGYGYEHFLGYSKYKDKQYILKKVNSYGDFSRHSIPCDGFLSGSKIVEDSFVIHLSPNIKYPIAKKINNTAISIRPLDGFYLENKREVNKSIRVVIFGRDIKGDKFKETCYITTYVDYITERDYSHIDSIMVIGSNLSVGIEVFPFITGEHAYRLRPIINRENFDSSICVVSVNKEKKTLTYNALKDRLTEYPQAWETIKSVPLDIPAEENITRNFCDTDSKFLYITTDAGTNGKLYVFPLIIPKTDDATLDFRKTEFQALTIEYLEDCDNDLFDIWIYPTSKTNDIEILTILINDQVYKSDIILDLMATNMESNRIQIPFSEFEINGIYNNYIIVSFETNGIESESTIAIQLDRTKLSPIFSTGLDLPTVAKAFKVEPASGEWYAAELRSMENDHKIYGSYGWGEEGYGGVISGSLGLIGFGGAKQIRAEGDFFKVSNSPYVYLDGQRIIFIYDTFYYNNLTDKILTHDTITHICASIDSPA